MGGNKKHDNDYHMKECNNVTSSDDDYNIFIKECKGYTHMPVIFPEKRRIIAIGDIHGDYDFAVKCLVKAKVINDNFDWIGGDTYVVQIGDQLDGCRGVKYKCNEAGSVTENNITVIGNTHLKYNKNWPNDINVMHLFTYLNNKAKKHGGAVISLLGNHELMNSLGNLSYVNYNDLQKSKNLVKQSGGDMLPNKTDASAEKARKNIFKPGNKYAKYMACNRLSAVIIGSFLFVHAGVTGEVAKEIGVKNQKDLFKINCFIRKWLLGLISIDNIPVLLQSINYSPFWQRILGEIPPDTGLDNPVCENFVGKTLKMLNVNGIIIGHTPQFSRNHSGINSTCNSTVWRIDTGGSESFSKFDNGEFKDERKIQVLEILDDAKINIIS